MGKRDPNQPRPPDQAQRELIASELDRNLLVEAAAGTGKTSSLVSRMVSLLATGTCEDLSRLAAVTFTRKAAAELRARFRISLEKEAAAEGRKNQRLTQALADLDQCFIGTIHAFCARLLHERPVEANLDVAFVELDEIADTRLREEAWEAFTNHLVVKDPQGVLTELDRQGIQLSDLQAAFIQFADYPDVEEWPASSPEKKIPDLDVKIKKIQNYVDDMLRTADQLPGDCGRDSLIPLYRIIPRVVNHFHDREDVGQLTDVLEQFDQKPKVVQKVWKESGKFTGDDAKRELQRFLEFNRKEVTPLLNHIYEQRYGPALRALEMARHVYDEIRQSRGYVNYQDLLMKTAQLLREQPRVREYFNRRFTHLLVDEFQDTDPIQAEVMLFLTASDPHEKDWRRCRPRPGSLFVVGDPKQSIYRFRRADIVTYHQVKEIIASGDGKNNPGLTVQLSANFRATGAILAWVNQVFEPAKEYKEDEGVMLRFPEASSEESPGYVPLQQGRVEGTDGNLKGVYGLPIPENRSKKDEAVAYDADLIARLIRHAVDTGLTLPRSQREIDDGKKQRADYSDFMIITRNSTNLSVYAAKLQEYGIPHQVTGGTALNEISELKLLYTCLAAITRPDDPVALVGALRSELFGISDASLYQFKQAGGQFSYHSAVPPGLEDQAAEAFADALARLERYAVWLSTMPPAAAVAAIMADSGLMVLAGSREGGEVQAGGLAKAVEILRGVQTEMWTAAQLVEYLGRLVEVEEKYDSVSVRAEERPRVRVMNLHQVKGLEAPVVFLADPSGDFEHGVDLHLDRSRGKTRGYLLIHGPSAGWKAKLIARPGDWDKWQDIEQRFTRAEELRLRYVAATRAGAALIISQRGKGNEKNPWQYFAEFIPKNAELPAPGVPAVPAVKKISLTAAQVREAGAKIAERLARAKAPTFVSGGARDYALARARKSESFASEPEPGPKPPAESGPPETAGEHGVEWGSVMHALLQLAMSNPNADLAGFAGAALAEYGLEPALAETAAKAVRAVMRAEIWQRALGSPRRLTEVPFHILREEPGCLPALVRGVIDLVFQEDDGWVLIDYKTDRASGPKLSALAQAYAPQVRFYAETWEQVTGQKVKALGLYFLAADSLKWLGPGSG